MQGVSASEPTDAIGWTQIDQEPEIGRGGDVLLVGADALKRAAQRDVGSRSRALLTC
jgi:hypothetical protein